MTETELRKGSASDASWISRLGLEELGRELGLVSEHLEGFPSSVAIRDGEGVGFLLSGSFAPDVLEIWHMRVHPEHRGQGVGSAMLGHLESELGSDVRALIVVNSGLYPAGSPRRSATPFYERHGFTRVHETPDTRILIKAIG